MTYAIIRSFVCVLFSSVFILHYVPGPHELGWVTLVAIIALVNAIVFVVYELVWGLIRAGIASIDIADGRTGRVDPPRREE